MITICWGFMPAETRNAFRPILTQYLWLLPSWMRLLHVGYRHAHENGDEQSLASCSVQPEYRQGAILVYAPWMSSNARERRQTVIHEMLHVPLGPMVKEQEEALDRLVPEDEAPKFRDTLKEQWRQRFEGSVQDLTFSISMLDPTRLPTVPFIEEEDEQALANDQVDRAASAA